MNESLWHELLKKELKTDDLGRFLKRPLLEGFELDLLATRSESWRDGNFRRAALSMSLCDESLIDWQQIPSWVASGVWDFILDPFLLGWDDSRLMEEMTHIDSVIKICPARIWIAHSTIPLPQGAFRILSAREIHARGGNAIHEMSSILSQVIDWAQSDRDESFAIAVYMDREFFKSIAKMRALKAMIESALSALGRQELLSRLTWMARVSWRDFTAFDQASNMLRNANSVAAGYLTGAAVVESLPADLLVENGLKLESSRVALTTQLILQNEAGLGEVSDPSSGCYSIENLTRALADKAWSEMQHLQSLPSESRETYLIEKAKSHWKEVQDKFKKRKIVQAGVNDFAQAEETVVLKTRWKRADHVRLGRDFEELRMQLGNSRPRVMIRLVGEYAALQARFNFAKNFFELLGLNPQDRKFSEPSAALAWRDESEIQVWVTGDDLHPQLIGVGERCYVAGKTSVLNCENIFHGIDICHSLKELLQWWGKRV
jgi:hypothetical protein